MGVEKWMNTNNVSPITMSRPCMTCSWRDGSFWDSTHIWFVPYMVLVMRDAITSLLVFFSMYGVQPSLCIIQCTYTPFTTFIDYGVRLLMDWIWIFPAHWMWHHDVIDMFWSWSSIFPSGWSWCHCHIIAMRELHMYFG
jgi:hypothetical protein